MLKAEESQETLSQKVTVKVPATVANIGSGFDAVGMALDIWNTLEVEPNSEQLINVIGEGKDTLPRNDTNLVIIGMKAAYFVGYKLLKENIPFNLVAQFLYDEKYLEFPIPPLKYTCYNEIPYGRGMGSSSAAIVSGLIAGLVLQGIEISSTPDEVLLNIACAIEGHPDNVAPTLYGGIQVGVKSATSFSETDPKIHWTTSRIPISHKLQCILLVPVFSVQTAEARSILSPTVTREDAVFNLSRTALLVQAFVTGCFHLLKIAMDDRLHQPQRAKKIMPHINPVIQAAIQAGAYGACLAGAGPSLLAFAPGDNGDVFEQLKNQRSNKLIGDVMLNAAKKCNVEARLFIVKPTTKGAYVVKKELEKKK